MSVVAALAFFQTAHAQTTADAAASTTAFYRGDAGHTGYSPTTMQPILSTLWQHTLPDVQAAYSTPALVGGVLYAGAGKHVYALNAKDGTTVWQYPADGSAASGTFNCSPAIADGKVFIGSDDNKLCVFDAGTGALLWQVTTNGAVTGAPVVSDGSVFFGCSDGHLYAINVASQQPIWGGEFRTDGPVFSSPIVEDGSVYFSDGNSNIYAVKQSSGEKIWTYLPSGGISPRGAVFQDGEIYVTSGSNILNISSRTGEVRSYYNIPATIVGPPTITSTNIYVSTSDQQIFCLTLHGNIVWHSFLQDIIATPMVATDNYLYATTRHGVVYALELSTGKPVWSYEIEKAIVHPGDKSQTTRQDLPQTATGASLLLQDGALFAIGNDGTVTEMTATAPDRDAPVVVTADPTSNSTIGGANIPFKVFVTDIGSGIDPSTVSLRVDGLPIPVFYDPTYGEVSVQYDRSKGNYGLSRMELPTLPDGIRTATLKIGDWRGNVLTKVWSFTVDNTLNPPGSSAPITLRPSEAGTQNITLGNGGPQIGIPTTSITATPGGAGAPQTQGGNGGNGGTTGGGGGGNVTVNNPGPGINYGPPPVAPPGTGGGGGGGGNGGGGGTGGFPPPPPI
jgi:outer membrane protein assembly factor BamB